MTRPPLPLSADRTCLVQTFAPRGPAELEAGVAGLPEGVDALEVRADFWRGEVSPLATWMRSQSCPLLLTVRRREEGGQFAGDEAARQARVAALAGEASAVDLEWHSELWRSSRPLPALVLSWHDFEGMPADLTETARRMRREAPKAVLKLAVTPQTCSDLSTILALPRQLEGPVAALGMGEVGLPSRALAGVIGSALAYAPANRAEATAPGQIPVAELSNLYRLPHQRADTPVLAVVGRPLLHSLSPLVHNRALAAQDLPGVYVPLQLDHWSDLELLDEVLALHGLSVTLPFKIDARHAARGPITTGASWPPSEGACNTLLRRKGHWYGDNTDRPGFRQALREGTQNLDLAGVPALVLGAGGVARTAVKVLLEEGARVAVASRTRSRTEALCAELGASPVPWEQRDASAIEVIINATPVGMHPQENRTPFPAAAFHEGQVVMDLIYRPRRTRLLEEAQAAGATTIEGLEMFLAQAALQYQHFTGQLAPIAQMRQVATAQLARDVSPEGRESS